MVNIYSECDHQFTVLKCPSVTRSWPKIAPLGCAGRADSHYRCAGRTNLQWPDDFTSIWTKNLWWDPVESMPWRINGVLYGRDQIPA